MKFLMFTAAIIVSTPSFACTVDGEVLTEDHIRHLAAEYIAQELNTSATEELLNAEVEEFKAELCEEN